MRSSESHCHQSRAQAGHRGFPPLRLVLLVSARGCPPNSSSQWLAPDRDRPSPSVFLNAHCDHGARHAATRIVLNHDGLVLTSVAARSSCMQPLRVASACISTACSRPATGRTPSFTTMAATASTPTTGRAETAAGAMIKPPRPVRLGRTSSSGRASGTDAGPPGTRVSPMPPFPFFSRHARARALRGPSSETGISRLGC